MEQQQQNDTKLRDLVDRGGRAATIMADPIVRAALDDLRQYCSDAWATSDGGDLEVRERAYVMRRLVDRFEQFFTLYIAQGRASERQLADALSKKTRRGELRELRRVRGG